MRRFFALPLQHPRPSNTPALPPQAVLSHDAGTQKRLAPRRTNCSVGQDPTARLSQLGTPVGSYLRSLDPVLEEPNRPGRAGGCGPRPSRRTGTLEVKRLYFDRLK